MMKEKITLKMMGLVCLAVLASAYGMEFFLHHLPCHLCLYERYVYAVAALVAFTMGPRWGWPLFGTLMAGGGLLSLYHVGVEQHFFALPATCGGPTLDASSVEALEAELLKTPIVRCDKPSFVLFGLSLAAYNALLSFGLAMAAYILRKK